MPASTSSDSSYPFIYVCVNRLIGKRCTFSHGKCNTGVLIVKLLRVRIDTVKRAISAAHSCQMANVILECDEKSSRPNSL